MQDSVTLPLNSRDVTLSIQSHTIYIMTAGYEFYPPESPLTSVFFLSLVSFVYIPPGL